MIGLLICTPFVRVSDHELRYLARVAAVLVVSQPPPTAPTAEDLQILTTTLSTCNFTPEPEPIEPFINGNLRYLYRSPIKARLPAVRRRYPIHQPCWRSGRWKSLT